MRIVDIRETAIPSKSTLANSSFDFTEMTTSVVAVITDVVRNGRPVCGFAFNSTGRYACGAQMRARFIPRILCADPGSLLDDAGDNLDPTKILNCMMRREKAGGHSERSIAIGTIEVAVWDAVAKIADKPLHVVLAERFNGGKPAKQVFCYVGGGWYWPGQTIRDLQDEMRRHLGAGYTMVKMKVGGLPLEDDVRRLEAVLEVVGSGENLAVDANCKFGRDEALRYARALAPFNLRWFEEPCDPLDFALFAELAALYENPLATGENLFSTPDVENLIRFGGFRSGRDVIQTDPPQAYGIGQYAATIDMLARHGWSRASLFPHGGNQMSLAIAAGFGLGGGESCPGVFGDFGGFAEDARIERGAISLSDRPGIGFEGQPRLYPDHARAGGDLSPSALLEGPSSPGACPGDSDLKRDAFLSEMAGTRPAMTLRFAKEQPGFQRLLEKIRSASSPRKWLFARDTVIG
jgi:D(-)-tartrate dehydratase